MIIGQTTVSRNIVAVATKILRRGGRIHQFIRAGRPYHRKDLP